MSSKVFRDPLYNYVSVDLTRDKWLLNVLNTREMQRLRRIHQLGVSNFTYPGADHSRLVHSLGVLHLMQLAVEHFYRAHKDAELDIARPALLATALSHDVGHGPFSHLFEPCLGIDHEAWSKRIITDPTTDLHQKLKACDSALPQAVADLVDPDNQERPPWQKYLISSQLDMDRLDYLRRDSLFTGAGYGHFDWHRLITTMELDGESPSEWEIIWGSKAMLAIEEYIFSRYYMYQNVYLHKTTRGFEQLLIAMWERAGQLRDDSTEINLHPAIETLWTKGDGASCQEFLAVEEFTVLSQIETWTASSDSALNDLSRRFLNRVPFAMIDAPTAAGDLDIDLSGWDETLKKLVEQKTSYRPVSLYCLKDTVKPKYNQPYFPEKEQDEQSVKNAIRVRADDSSAVEISTLLPRMQPLTEIPAGKIRYYVPSEVKADARKMRGEWRP